MRYGLAAALTTCAAVLLLPCEAGAVRFTLGIAGSVTPLVVDPGRASSEGLRLGLRPVLDVEATRWLAIGAYAPFTLIRTGGDTATTGADSVFGLSVAGRYAILTKDAPEETLIYGLLRGGFGTYNGRAGPFVGVGAGISFTWLETGRGWFAEIDAGRFTIGAQDEDHPGLERWTAGLSVGLVFHLAGERWKLGGDGG